MWIKSSTDLVPKFKLFAFTLRAFTSKSFDCQYSCVFFPWEMIWHTYLFGLTFKGKVQSNEIYPKQFIHHGTLNIKSGPCLALSEVPRYSWYNENIYFLGNNAMQRFCLVHNDQAPPPLISSIYVDTNTSRKCLIALTFFYESNSS